MNVVVRVQGDASSLRTVNIEDIAPAAGQELVYNDVTKQWEPKDESVPAAAITGTLPISHGGTNATTAVGARSALGLGDAAIHSAADFATAAQGVKADQATHQMGAWSGATAYVLNDVVQSGGSSYVCILANTNNIPPNPTYWAIFAAKGQQGDPGVNGISGASVTPFTSQTSVVVTHNFGSYPVVNVINGSNEVIFPVSITHNSVNAFTVVFSGSTSGNIIATIGGVSTAVVTKVADYNITSTDYLVLGNSANITFTLPSAVGLQGHIYAIKKIDASGPFLKIAAQAGEYIDGQPDISVTAQYTAVTLQSDNTQWLVI